MPYVIANEEFKTKSQVTDRCRKIIAATPDDSLVAEESLSFLLALFQHHDEWLEKAKGGVCGITTQKTLQGTRCFVLNRHDGSQIDISFPHAIRLMPSRRKAELFPQGLRDFRSAARTAIESQIQQFRDEQLAIAHICPITGVQLHRGNCAVDHEPPMTFDSLAFDFCQKQGINPLEVVVGSDGGTIAVFEDKVLLQGWYQYHKEHAVLRLVSKIGNLQLPKTKVAWEEFFNR